MMRAALLLPLVTACVEVSVRDIEVVGDLTPGFTDLGEIWVGEVVDTEFRVDGRFDAEPLVTDVVVRNLAGEAFSVVEAEEVDLLNAFTVRWQPLVAGYQLAEVVVTSDALNSPHVVQIRGEALEPALRIEPPGIDFGNVAPGEVKLDKVLVTNTTDGTITLSALEFSDPAFFSDEVIPYDLLPASQWEIPVGYLAPDDQRRGGELRLRLGEAVVGVVRLRANDCLNGDASVYDEDQDGFASCGGDCDDTTALVRPGAVELADGVDQDCDGFIDEGTRGADDDGDGYCEDEVTCSDGVSLPGDCSDGDADVFPGQEEILSNGVDDDCDGQVDLDAVDRDGDGYTEEAGDCDDLQATMYPGQAELSDGLDNDCDGEVDEGTAGRDDDGDGYCESPSACTDGSLPGDCDDTDPRSAPSMPEEPDGADNDCNQMVDENTTRGDDDGDGFTELGGDCDDADPRVNPARGNCPVP